MFTLAEVLNFRKYFIQVKMIHIIATKGNQMKVTYRISLFINVLEFGKGTLVDS